MSSLLEKALKKIEDSSNIQGEKEIQKDDKPIEIEDLKPPKAPKIEIQKISDNFFVELANSTEFKRFIYKVLYGKVHRTEKQHGNLDEKVKIGLEVFQEFERGTRKDFREVVKELKEKLAEKKVKVENESNNTVVDI